LGGFLLFFEIARSGVQKKGPSQTFERTFSVIFRFAY
jgi:hypothetical protein